MTAPYWEDGRPPELEAVRRDDALLDALSARGDASSTDDLSDADPVVRLLSALVEDVSAQPIEEPVERPADGCVEEAEQGSGRKGQERRLHGRKLPRSFVALSVTGVVLASTGVAAAAGGLSPFTSASDARDQAPHSHVSISSPATQTSSTPTAKRPRTPEQPGPTSEEGPGIPILSGTSPKVTGSGRSPGAPPSTTQQPPTTTPTPSVTPDHSSFGPDLAGDTSTPPARKQPIKNKASELTSPTKGLGLPTS